MSRKRKLSILVFIFTAGFSTCSGILISPYIGATSTATQISGGLYDGWYLYEIEVQWYFEGPGSGLSHWDIILKPGCAEDDHLFAFDTPAGYSTSENFPNDANALGWSGKYEENGDGSISGVTDPIIKYDEPFFPDTDEPGSAGHGTFWFYANIIPESDTYHDKIVSKGGSGVGVVYGDLSGDYPSCTTIPEPATLVIMTLCWLGVRRRFVKVASDVPA